MSQTTPQTWKFAALGASALIGAMGIAVMTDSMGTCVSKRGAVEQTEEVSNETKELETALAVHEAKSELHARSLEQQKEELAKAQAELVQTKARLLRAEEKYHDHIHSPHDSEAHDHAHERAQLLAKANLGELAKNKGNIPEKLSKAQVQQTIRKYNGRISTCARQHSEDSPKGTVWVSIDIHEDGTVSNTEIIGKSAKFRGTDVGDCILGVVRKMDFPEARESLSISQYPFVLR